MSAPPLLLIHLVRLSNKGKVLAPPAMSEVKSVRVAVPQNIYYESTTEFNKDNTYNAYHGITPQHSDTVIQCTS